MKLRVAYGHVMRRIRQNHNKTLREVSKQAGISPAHLSEFERGKNEISSELFDSLCRAFQVRPAEVVLEAYRVMSQSDSRQKINN